MRVRALNGYGDWTFGSSQGNYLTYNAAIGQNITTRLNTILGECFFNVNIGLPWFDYLASKNQLAINLAVSATILGTQGVQALNQLSVTLDESRNLTIIYSVLTIYPGIFNGQFQALLSQYGNILTDQYGNPLFA